MKWLKHHTDSSSLSPYVSQVEDRFGLEGYARMFKLKEAVASQMTTKDSPTTVEYPVNKWCQILKCKRKVLTTFFGFLHKKNIIAAKRTENGIRVTFDKLRDSLDNRASSSKARVSRRDPKQNRIEQDEKRTHQEQTFNTVVGGNLFSKLNRTLKGTNVKEDLVQFLIDCYTDGHLNEASFEKISTVIEDHFAKIKSEKSKRLGNLMLSRANSVFRMLSNQPSNSMALMPSAAIVSKVLQKGFTPLDEDKYYEAAREKIKAKTYGPDELFYIKHRYQFIEKMSLEWIPKYENELVKKHKGKLQ